MRGLSQRESAHDGKEAVVVSSGSVRVVFMGTSRFAVPSLEALVRAGYRVVGVVSQPPRPAGRGRKVAAPPVVEVAERHGLPVLTPEKLRAPEAVQAVAGLRPDLIVVAAYAQLLPRSVLSLPARGCVNVHGSLLPRWRGASPMQAAILSGDEFTGVTLMEMAEAMDSGAILGQSMTRVEDGDTTPDLEERLSRMGAVLLASVLPCYLDGNLRPVPQDESLVTFASTIPKEAGLIDWSRPAVEIWRRCRAYRPWPGTYTFWKGKMLKVVSCWAEPSKAEAVEPGAVLADPKAREVAVATGEGVLRLLEVAPEGGRVMGGYEFSLGHRDFVGSHLG